MGIRSPTADEVWNWRENVKKGIDRLNEKVLQAEEYPGQVRSSIEFQALVEAFNQKRISEGKPAIDVQLPPFDKEQLIRDAIRGYDGWDDAGQFGLGLHEYRVPTIQDGSLKVDETTGKVDWELVTTRSAGNLDYVDDVLSSSSSFAMVCELEPLPPLQRTPSPEEQLCELLESDSFSSDEIDGIVEQTITIPRTEIYNAFDRLGHLRCKKPISKTGNNPCRVGVNHQGKHSVPVRLEDQKTVTLAESHSEGTHSQIQGSVAAKVEGAIGIPLLAKAKGSLETKIKGSRAWTDTDTTSVVIEIRNTLATTETLEMEGHAEDGFEIALPYGLRVIVTTEGNVRVRRQWTHDAQAGICQLGDVEIILVDLTADVSVEADTQPANMELVESLRETCP